MLHSIWLDVSNQLAPEEVHHHDIVHFALEELQHEMSEPAHDERDSEVALPSRASQAMTKDLRARAAALVAVAAIVARRQMGCDITNATTVALTFLLVVLVVAATSRLWIAVVTSIVAMLCFNFFVLPPVGAWTIADPQNWVALLAFLAVSLVANSLSSVARAKTDAALARHEAELARQRRRVQIGSAGVARAQPAHAADGHQGGRGEPAGVVVDRRRTARAERADPRRRSSG